MKAITNPDRPVRRAVGRGRVVPPDTLALVVMNGERWLCSTTGNWRIHADATFTRDLNGALRECNQAAGVTPPD